MRWVIWLTEKIIHHHTFILHPTFPSSPCYSTYRALTNVDKCYVSIGCTYTTSHNHLALGQWWTKYSTAVLWLNLYIFFLSGIFNLSVTFRNKILRILRTRSAEEFRTLLEFSQNNAVSALNWHHWKLAALETNVANVAPWPKWIVLSLFGN